MGKVELTTWGIRKFPRVLKNKFIGMCKMRGLIARDVVVGLVKQWVKDHKYEEVTTDASSDANRSL